MNVVPSFTCIALTDSCRNNYAAAKLQGLVEDLHLVGDQYQTGLSILFVGYILIQVRGTTINISFYDMIAQVLC